MYGKGLLKGLNVTLSYHMKKKITKQYPEQKPDLAARFRGCLEYDMDKCIACNSCVKTCPNGVLELHTVKGADSKRRPVSFVINLQYCMFCSFCVDVCPTNSLYFSHNFELACFNREQIKLSYQTPTVIEIPVPTETTAPAAAMNELAVALASKQDLVKKFTTYIEALTTELQNDSLGEEERQQIEERLAKLNTALALAKRDAKQLKTQVESHNNSEQSEADLDTSSEILKSLVDQINTLKNELQNQNLSESGKMAKNKQLDQLTDAIQNIRSQVKAV